MKLAIILSLVAAAVALPAYSDEKVAEILRDDRVEPEGGAYSFDIETENGIKRSEAGQSRGDAGAVNKAGEVSFPLPNGEQFYLKFVADDKGFKPESEFLPVAPAFPHPIPQFVLDQIAFAAEEDRNRPLSAARGDYVGYDEYSK